MKKGSITVFLALTLVLVLSFIFSLLEGARVCCLQTKAQLATDICMQSVFGNYHKGVWEDYHLLFLDGSWQGEEFSMEKFIQRAMDELEVSLSKAGWELRGWDLTALKAIDFETESYEMATDGEGNVFCRQLVRQIQKEAALAVLQELLQLQEFGSTAAKEQDQQAGKWELAWDALSKAEQQKDSEKTQEKGQQSAEATKFTGAAKSAEASRLTVGARGVDQQRNSEQGEESRENPMEYIKGIRESSILGLVLKDSSQLSGKVLAEWNPLERREKNQGNWPSMREVGMTDRLWQQYYIQSYFSNYTATPEKGAKEKTLDYEMEYIIAGKSGDRENLETVVYELLGIREALNFATLLKDTQKKALAFEIATAAVGFTGVIPLIKAVQIGVLLAWAFAESVLDVRSLLAGGHIPFFKQAGQWSSDLTDVQKSIESDVSSSEEEDGLNYTQYLQILLFLLSQKTINYRSMDMIEKNEQVKMDNMLQSVKSTASYEASPLFWSLSMIGKKRQDAFFMTSFASMTYENIQ